MTQGTLHKLGSAKTDVLLEQHGSELRGCTSMQIFLSKYRIVLYPHFLFLVAFFLVSGLLYCKNTVYNTPSIQNRR